MIDSSWFLLHLNAIIQSCWIYERNFYDFLFKLFFLFPFHISRLTWLLDCGKFFCTVWCVLKKELDMCHFLECVAIFLHAWASSPPAAWKWKDSMYALKWLRLWSFLPVIEYRWGHLIWPNLCLMCVLMSKSDKTEF